MVTTGPHQARARPAFFAPRPPVKASASASGAPPHDVALPTSPEGLPIFEMSAESASAKQPLEGQSSRVNSPETEPDHQANPWPFYLDDNRFQSGAGGRSGDTKMGKGQPEEEDGSEQDSATAAAVRQDVESPAANPWPYHGPQFGQGDAPGATVYPAQPPPPPSNNAAHSEEPQPSSYRQEETTEQVQSPPAAQVQLWPPPAASSSTDAGPGYHFQDSGNSTLSNQDYALQRDSYPAPLRISKPKSPRQYKPYSPPPSSIADDEPRFQRIASPSARLSPTHPQTSIPYRPYCPPGAAASNEATTSSTPATTTSQSGLAAVYDNHASPPEHAQISAFSSPPPPSAATATAVAKPGTPGHVSSPSHVSSPGHVFSPGQPPYPIDDDRLSPQLSSTETFPSRLPQSPSHTHVSHPHQASAAGRSTSPLLSTSASASGLPTAHHSTNGLSSPVPSLNSGYGRSPSPVTQPTVHTPQATYAAFETPSATKTSSPRLDAPPESRPQQPPRPQVSQPPAGFSPIPTPPGPLSPPPPYSPLHSPPADSVPSVPPPPPGQPQGSFSQGAYPTQPTYATTDNLGPQPATTGLSPPPLPPRPSSANAHHGSPVGFGFTGAHPSTAYPPPPKTHYRPPPPPLPLHSRPPQQPSSSSSSSSASRPPHSNLFKGSSSAKKWLDKTNQVLEETLGPIMQGPSSYRPPAAPSAQNQHGRPPYGYSHPAQQQNGPQAGRPQEGRPYNGRNNQLPGSYPGGPGLGAGRRS